MGQLVFVSFANEDAPAPVFPLNIYVDPTDGDDANTGLTPASPVLTLTRVWNIVPGTIEGSVTIHVASGELAWVPMPRIVQATEDACIVFYGDGAGQGVQDGFIVVDSGVTQADTSAVQVVLPVGPAANAFQGMTLEITSGLAAGSRKTIRDNTGGGTPTAFPCVPFVDQAQVAVDPGVGADYRVVRPATTITVDTLTGSAVWFEGQGGGQANLPIVLANFDIEATEVGDILVVSESNILLLGVRIQQGILRGVRSWIAAGAVMASDGSTGFNNELVMPLAEALGATPAEIGLWFGWGYTNLLGGFVGLGLDSESRFLGNLCTAGIDSSIGSNTNSDTSQDGTYTIYGCFIQFLLAGEGGKYKIGFFEDGGLFVPTVVATPLLSLAYLNFSSPVTFRLDGSTIFLMNAEVRISAPTIDIIDPNTTPFTLTQNSKLILGASPVAADGGSTFLCTGIFFLLSNASELLFSSGGLFIGTEGPGIAAVDGSKIVMSGCSITSTAGIGVQLLDSNFICSESGFIGGLSVTAPQSCVVQGNSALSAGLANLVSTDAVPGLTVQQGGRAIFSVAGALFQGSFGIDASLGGFVSLAGPIDDVTPSDLLTVGADVTETITAANFNLLTANDGIGNTVSGKGASQIIRTA